jgi:hypothetical protein
VLSAVLGVVEAGARGGALAYERAGRVGVASGVPGDVGWLLLAGLHHQTALDERAGRPADAAELRDLAARRFPGEAGVQLEAAEASLHDRTIRRRPSRA